MMLASYLCDVTGTALFLGISWFPGLCSGCKVKQKQMRQTTSSWSGTLCRREGVVVVPVRGSFPGASLGTHA